MLGTRALPADATGDLSLPAGLGSRYGDIWEVFGQAMKIICIECRRREHLLKVMDGALGIAAELGAALVPLIPKPESLDPNTREQWQRVVNAIYSAAEYAEKHDLEQWGGKANKAN